MKNTLKFSLLFSFFFLIFQTVVAINITPLPKEVKINKGHLTIKSGVSICTKELEPSIAKEVKNFINVINNTTSIRIKDGVSSGKIIISVDSSCSQEGYKLDIKKHNIIIKASSSDGFFYAFQTIKKLLPPNVIVGIKDTSIHELVLPLVTINDEPRFNYRGFMLDVSRHFFTIDEIKHMLNLMAIYKMNKFHWHLTDDQGWRIEIKKYPRLTKIGSKSQNCRMNDMINGVYWTNEEYGPHFYTQEQIKELVNYATMLHIEIIPEIDMPGHFCAAMASYPQFSCAPKEQHNVLTYQGGVWDDVLNVGDNNAIDFAKNILREIFDLFPSHYVHIGGDECPTTAWEKNEQCKEKYKNLKLSSYRELQSFFIKEISNYAKLYGKKIIVWNESITAPQANKDLIKEADATIMAWNPCQEAALMAAKLGLNTIITEYHSKNGSYYINRKQSQEPKEPVGAGNGDDTVERCYNYIPVPQNLEEQITNRYIGVQATFWTEWVSDVNYLYYLAVPRIVAVAEAGWSPQNKKNFIDFRLRMQQDSSIFKLGKYNYAKHIFKTK